MTRRFHRHSVSMTDALYLRVKAYARSMGWTTTGFVTEVLTRYLDEHGASDIGEDEVSAHRNRKANGRASDPFDRRKPERTASPCRDHARSRNADTTYATRNGLHVVPRP